MSGIISFYSNMKIKYKIFMLIAILMGSVILLTNLIHNIAFKAYDELVYQQSSKALGITSLSMETELKKILTLSYNVITDSALQEYLWTIRNAETDYVSYVTYTQVRQRLVDLGALDKYILSLQLYDVNHKEFTVGSRPVNLNDERMGKVIEYAQDQKGAIGWIAPDVHDHSLTAVRHIRRYQDLSLTNLGVLAIRIDMERLFSEYVNVDDQEPTAIIIVNGENEIVFPKQVDIDMQTLSEVKNNNDRYQIIRQNGKSFFLTYRTSASTNWTYYTLAPYDHIFNSTDQAKKNVLIVYLALFVLASVIAFQLAKRITDPLEKLTLKMRKVQLGNFQYENSAEIILSKDEVGQIQRHFRIMLERINELIQENYIKQLVIKDTQFKALQAQINPHFLYNTLESINWMAKMSKQDRISQMVESLGYLLRLSISEQDSVITLHKELHIVQQYLVIQKLRFEERLDFQLDVPEHLVLCTVPKLSIQPIVENAINYALEPNIEPCIIKVSAHINNNLLHVSIADNGPGMSEEIIEKLKVGEVESKGTGLGLLNISERIKMLYGDQYGIQIQSNEANGTTVTLILPYIVRDDHV